MSQIRFSPSLKKPRPPTNSYNKFDLSSQRKSLPIFNVKEELINEINKHSTLIILGETGSGKTTQIPQYIYEATKHDSKLIIGCTQPRRVAAITIAQRVAAEHSDEPVGEIVGYNVRFEDCTSENTIIKFLTDGMLLRECISDKLLRKYSTIILDEAHERTIHTDILFGIVKSAQRIRKLKNMPNLRIIVMSATMDVDHFAKYFCLAKVLYIEGRLHKIEKFYAPKHQPDYLEAALITIFQIHREGDKEGDILVFLTGQEEIEAMARTIKEVSVDLPQDLPKLMTCQLYSSLPQHQQMKAFHPAPKGKRKIVLSTNIAETSVTIKGIKYVVDTGKVKQKSFHSKTKLEMLSVQNISQAQAWQRAGRAGRERAGVVHHLYTEDEFFSFAEMPTPEIQRCNISNVILQMLAVGVKNIEKFDFIDRPSSEVISKALTELEILGAISGSREEPVLTAIGKKMSVFPLEPKLAKVIISSAFPEHRCTEEALTLVALLSVDSIFFNPHTKREEANATKRKFTSSEGDHQTLLNIYHAYKKCNMNKHWCYENYINAKNMEMAGKIRVQLRELLPKAGITEVYSNRNDKTALRKCVASGLFLNTAEMQHDGSYKFVGSGETVHIHPSSCLFHCKPAYIVFNELIYTTKCYIRDLCVVDPVWVYNASPSFFKHKLKSVS